MSLASDGVDVDVSDAGVAIDWAFWDRQLEALDALRSGDYDLVVFRGGYGSGKSILGSRWIHQTALSVPKSDNLVMAQDTAKGGPTTYKVFFEQLPGAETVPAEGGDPENSPIVEDYNRNERRLTYVTGAVARLGSADKWNRYAGAEFNAVWCDEVAHYPPTTDLYRLNRMLLSRQRTADGPNVALWTSTGNGYNQFYDFVERQVDADDEPLPTRIHNVVADSRNNPFLPEKDKLRRQFEGTASEKQGLAGGFAAAEGRVYDGFSRTTHIVDRADVDDRLDEDWRLYAYDAGWDDPRVILEIARTHRGQYVVVDMLYASGIHIGDPERVRDPERAPDPGTALDWLTGRQKGVIYSEHAPADIDKFRRAGWEARRAEKDIDGGIDAVRERLEVDDEGRPGLLVVDDCVPLIQEFLGYQEDHVGKSDVDDHALDALRYAIFTNSVRSDDAGSGGSFARSF